MKRPRKPAPMAPAGIPKDLIALAKEKLSDDYLSFIAGTTAEDPKLFLARLAAAAEALEHMAKLDALSGGATPEADTAEALLAATRADIAREDGG